MQLHRRTRVVWLLHHTTLNMPSDYQNLACLAMVEFIHGCPFLPDALAVHLAEVAVEDTVRIEPDLLVPGAVLAIAVLLL